MDGDSDKTSPSASILARFTGDQGGQLLLEVLSESTLLRGLPGIAELVASSTLLDVAQGTTIIEQGAADNDIYIILSGSFAIRVNGRDVTTRHVGAHVGEMALIDSTARRSASVIANDHSVVLKCAEPQFTSFANANPKVWRRLAVELSRRLTERNALISTPRSQPVLFIGCSKEGLEIAREIQSALDFDPVVVELWTDGVFNPSKTPIEDLTALTKRIDFGVLLLTPDDKIVSREVTNFGPRDNVLFELGLVMGAIGRERTFLMAPRGVDFKIPSDLLAVKPLDYPGGDATTAKSRIGPLCNELRKVISRLGPM